MWHVSPVGAQMRWTILLFAVLGLTVYGQLVIKARALRHASESVGTPDRLHYLLAMFTDLWVLSGLGAAVLAGAFWMLAIERLQISYAYPFIALSFVFVPLGATALFGEPLPAVRLLGIALIIAGITVSALAR
jgi:multidrug transporter EmrE-like cation transporter